MFYRAVAATCPGNDKAYNSNNIYLNTKYITDEIKASEVLLKQKKEQQGLQFYGIAEGFGAKEYSEEASLIAAKKLYAIQKKSAGTEISDNYDEAADVVYSYLEDFIKDAQEAVVAKSSANSDSNIYSSIAVIGFYETAAITCNLGNTRIYLFRKGRLNRLTQDHNQAQVMHKNGVLSAEQAAEHPKKNKLTQYLGVLPDGKEPEPYYSEVEVKHGDIFVICSSTFCSSVSDDDICTMVKESRSLSQIAEKLMHAAAEKGFSDDTSILVVRADSHENAAVTGAAAGSAGAASAAAAGTKSGAVSAAEKSGAKNGVKSANNAGSRNSGGNTKGKEVSGGARFINKVKKILGIGADAENEKMWPALLMFAGCILIVIILAVLGVKIYNASKSSAPKTPANQPTSVISTPSAQSPTGETPSASAPTGGVTEAPTETPTGATGTASETPTAEVPTVTVTEAPQTQTVTPVPPTQAATPEPPTPTQAPPTQTVTPVPPTQTPTQQPPTENPTQPSVTEAPPTEETPATEAPPTEATVAPTESATAPSETEAPPTDSEDTGGPEEP